MMPPVNRRFVCGLVLGLMLLMMPLAVAAAPSAKWPDDVDPGSRPLYRAPALTFATGPTVAGDTPGALYYTVQPGDTLWLIARRFGITVEVLSRENGFTGRKVLREGMELFLPYSNEIGSARYVSGRPVVKGRGLHFVASISQQQCWLFRDGKIVERWTCSTGRPESPSIPGNYTVQTKMPRAFNTAAEFWMPAWLGIYDAGDADNTENGIHGIPYRASNGERLWTDLVGTPITFGCVMLSDDLAQKLYDLADIGMPVTVLP